MSKYIPKLIHELEEDFILLDNVFSADMVINYAKKHNYNIKFTCSTSTCATEILCKIQEAGYELDFARVPVSHEGLYLYDDFVVYCYLRDESL